jgi:hypothetical protein
MTIKEDGWMSIHGWSLMDGWMGTYLIIKNEERKEQSKELPNSTLNTESGVYKSFSNPARPNALA